MIYSVIDLEPYWLKSNLPLHNDFESLTKDGGIGMRRLLGLLRVDYLSVLKKVIRENFGCVFKEKFDRSCRKIGLIVVDSIWCCEMGYAFHDTELRIL